MYLTFGLPHLSHDNLEGKSNSKILELVVINGNSFISGSSSSTRQEED